eukprot:CAMPEP_0184747760 /NCGR_PEP_ID=MMETSP0315-20130426/13340_1 /TAXON_ID=101924 /ORGANISM="Rhodosorus marinus, Strain UTEX LB 2760" /LENGTH=47 /DNA_ID= /DNA_START= /DNA_END= /DNA_ORIENTATION=
MELGAARRAAGCENPGRQVKLPISKQTFPQVESGDEISRLLPRKYAS